MQEPRSEGVAHHADPESCAGGGNVAGEALTGENAGQVLSSEITSIGVPTRSPDGEGHTRRSIQRELPFDAAESETLCMRGHSLGGNRETRKAPSRPEKVPGTVSLQECGRRVQYDYRI